MGITRRDLFKGALATGALALVPSWLGKANTKTVLAAKPVAYWPLHGVKIWNRALSDLEILEQYDIAQSQKVASRMAKQLDAKIMAGTTGAVSFPGLSSMWDIPEDDD